MGKYNFDEISRDILFNCIQSSFGKLSFDVDVVSLIKEDRLKFIETTKKTILSIEKAVKFLFEELNDDEAKHFTEWLTWNGTGENAQPTLKIFFEATKNQERIISTDIKAGSTNEGTILTSEARDFLKVTYLKPLRDAKNELIPKKNSRLAQIFQEHEAFKGQNDTHLLVELFKKFDRFGWIDLQAITMAYDYLLAMEIPS